MPGVLFIVNQWKSHYDKAINREPLWVPERMVMMYYSSGNYEAFARPLKPEGVDHKSAYFIGTGLAAQLSSFLSLNNRQTKIVV